VKAEPGLLEVTLLSDFDNDVLSSVRLGDTSTLSFGSQISLKSDRSFDLRQSPSISFARLPIYPDSRQVASIVNAIKQNTNREEIQVQFSIP
jgi:hypothetical protein